MNYRILFRLASASLAMTTLLAGGATFSPVPLSNDSFTQDMIVEKTATQALPPATSGSMDAGLTNTGYSWYELGYNLDAPDTGLPAPGSTLASATFLDHSYTLASSYTDNNVVLIGPTVSNATVTFPTPVTASALSFLSAAGHGPVTVGLTFHYADGSTETNRLVSLDWFGGTNVAFTASGRVDVVSRRFASVGSGDPRLYSVDLPLNNTITPVTSVDLKLLAGTGHAAIFAISAGTGGGFSPVTLTGYNADLVVEADASLALGSLGATTASLDAGVVNTGFSLYEQGYNTAAPSTGLPPAGSTVTNAASTDHSYKLPASYAANDAVLVDSDNPSATLTLATPAPYTGVSFLTTSGSGAVKIDYSINHADGTAETGSFLSPDWFNNIPVALTMHGRVSVESGSFDSVNTDNPRLYAIDLAVTNAANPIVSIALTYASGAGHAMILALSGTTGSVQPVIDVQPAAVNSLASGTVNLGISASGVGPLRFQWQHQTGGTTNYVSLTDTQGYSGSTTTNLTISTLTMAQAGNYRVVVSNAAGSTTSTVAQVNLVSAATDVTSPKDLIISFGGDSPAIQSVTNAIDNTTSKYLNFGTDHDQDPPFVGPVGLIVTPGMGSTVVTGLRIYTADDVPDRDPVDYMLEGSNSGTNFTAISSGPLSLPDGRNAAGAALDPITQFNQEVGFQNTAAYTSYRLTFHNVKNNTTANSLQIGEIELLGTKASGTSGATLTIVREANGTLTLSSSQPGTLESTTALNGPSTAWHEEGPITGSTTVTASGAARFYRVLVQ